MIVFLPGPYEPQTIEIGTAWGVTLPGGNGDVFIGELKHPDKFWPFDPFIFDVSYGSMKRNGWMMTRSRLSNLIGRFDISHPSLRVFLTVTREGYSNLQ